jgi:hypothetical protein
LKVAAMSASPRPSSIARSNWRAAASMTGDDIPVPPNHLRSRLIYIKPGHAATLAQFFPRNEPCVYALKRYDDVSIVG